MVPFVSPWMLDATVTDLGSWSKPQAFGRWEDPAEGHFDLGPGGSLTCS